MIFKKKKGIAGIDVGSSSVKAVELSGTLEAPTLIGFGFGELPSGTVVEGQIISVDSVAEGIGEAIEELSGDTTKVVAGVSGNSVIVKNVIIPNSVEGDLGCAIEWHASENIPFELSEVNLDYHVAGEANDSTQVTIAACKRDHIEVLRESLTLAGAEPVAIDVDALAFQNCYEINYAPEENAAVVLLNIGADTMNVNIVLGDESLFTRDIALGGSHYTRRLSEGLGLESADAERLKLGKAEMSTFEEMERARKLIDDVTEEVALEIRKVLDFCSTLFEGGEFHVEKMLIAGGGSKLEGLDVDLGLKLGMEVERFDAFRNISIDDNKIDVERLREYAPEMAVAVGLALRGVELR